MRRSKKLVSLVLCLTMLLSCFVGASVSTVNAADTTPNTKYSSDEVILHCWNWPISTIRDNLQDIADAGYTAIQTSPINGIVGSGNSVTNWYQFYQPVNYNIGNKICTEAEFKIFCSEAHALGLKVIVDVVLNHTTDQTSMVDTDLKDYHGNGGISNWDDRWQQTQQDITGMPDLNTNNTTIQTKARAMLQKIIADGADGFRYDAAKHIELPEGEEISGCPTSDYWPTVTSNLGDTFSYGEVLAGQNCPLYNYSKYMNVTGSAYSDTVRNNITNNVLNASDLNDFKAGLGGNNLVCWVESHDNYVDGNYGMPEDQIKLAWAAITAQNLNTLFLARPCGATTSNWKGSDNTAEGGDGFYFDEEVVAVNKFHNAAKGQGVAVENVNGNNQLFAVKRGSVGVCIINTGSSSKSVSVSTSMPNGTYTDEANGGTFTVNNGYISGNVGAGKVAVIYRGGVSADTDFYVRGSFNSWETNEKMTKDGNVYSYTYNLSAGDHEFKIYDSNGNWYGNSGTIIDTTATTSPTGWDMSVSESSNCTLRASGGAYTFSYNPTANKLIITKGEATSETTVVTGKTATLAADAVTNGDEDWCAWTWGKAEGKLVKGNNNVFSGLDDNVVFFRIAKGNTPDANWTNVWNQTDDLVTVDGGTYTITGWGEPGANLIGTWTQPTPSDKKGDVDGNGVVDINDVTIAQRSLIGLDTLTDDQKALADANNDGKFTLRDVTLIQMYIAHIIYTI